MTIAARPSGTNLNMLWKSRSNAMGYDGEKAEAKRRELQGMIAQTLKDVPADEAGQLAAKAAEYFADITAPYWEPPPMELVTMGPKGHGGGVTVKPGNIVLNLHKLVRAIATGALTIAGTTAAPWTLILGALVTWDNLWSCLKLKINDVQACVLWSLWQARDARNTIAKASVLEAVQRERQAAGEQPLSQEQIDCALEDLAKMKCIKQSSSDPERWWLREWVKIKY
jgi:hypothetical protein